MIDLPPHPMRVAEAMLPAINYMMDNVYDGPMRARSVYCQSYIDNGVQRKVVTCLVKYTNSNETDTTTGKVTKGACINRVYEDVSGRVTVRTHSRGVWCYRFHNRYE
jgi:hypothetical protein